MKALNETGSEPHNSALHSPYAAQAWPFSYSSDSVN